MCQDNKHFEDAHIMQRLSHLHVYVFVCVREKGGGLWGYVCVCGQYIVVRCILSHLHLCT